MNTFVSYLNPKPLTLLEKCNADVYMAILEIKCKYPAIGEQLIAILQKHEHWFDMTALEILQFSANLPHKIWNGNIFEVMSLFKTELTTTIKVKL